MVYPESVYNTAVDWQDGRWPNGLAAIASGNEPDLFDLRRELDANWNLAADDDLPWLSELAAHFGLEGFELPVA